ncbi:MAG: hypothetical protein R3C68_16320 [Myxococcota bacterium]
MLKRGANRERILPLLDDLGGVTEDSVRQVAQTTGKAPGGCVGDWALFIPSCAPPAVADVYAAGSLQIAGAQGLWRISNPEG